MTQRDRVHHHGVGSLPECHRADVGEIHLLRVPEVADEGAAGTDRQRVGAEAETIEALRLELVEQDRPGRLGLEAPGIHRCHRHAGRRQLRQVLREHEIGGHDELSRPQDRHLVHQGLEAVSPGVLRRAELAGREIDQGGADRLQVQAFRGTFGFAGVLPSRAVGLSLEESRRRVPSRRASRPARLRERGCHGHEERRLPRVKVGGIGQGPRRHHPDHLPPDKPLGLPRVLDLVADCDPKALLHEAREVAVHRVVGHPAHGDRAARGVLASGGERQFERPGRHQGVLVEHLVEVAHPEEHDGIAVLPLGVEVLTHRRGRLRGGPARMREVVGLRWHESPIPDSLQ